MRATGFAATGTWSSSNTPGDLLTVYAHNSLLMVAQGQPVRAGDRIALVGQSGRATGPHLHFEVRTGQIPRNPMSFLPDVPRGST